MRVRKRKRDGGRKKGQITREKNRRGESAKKKRREVSELGTRAKEREGESGSRSATLHSRVFHFNGPPGDWLTRAVSSFICPLACSLQRFRHNGPGALLIRRQKCPRARARDRESLVIITAVHLVHPTTERDSAPFLSSAPSSPSSSSSSSSSSYFRFRSLPASIEKN